MKKLALLIGFAVFSLLIMPGCKKKQKSSDLDDSVPYYQEYAAVFNKTDNTTSATAFIRLNNRNGNRISFTDGAYLHAEGVNENDKDAASDHYQWFFGEVKTINFEIKKNGGTSIINNISPADVGSLSFGSMPSSFSKSIGFSFHWIGDDLLNDELKVTLAGHNGSGTEVTKTLTANKDKTIWVLAGDVIDINNGDIKIKMERSRKLPLDATDGSAGGDMKATTIVSKSVYMSN